jgi:hypothetical protein
MDDLRGDRSHLPRAAAIELNPGVVAREQRRDIPRLSVIDAVGHHLSDYGRPARDAERPLPSIAPPVAQAGWIMPDKRFGLQAC